MTKHRKLKIELLGGKVSAILDTPSKTIAALALAHGAGAGMAHPFMSKLAEGLCSAGISVLRFQFPYMEKGLKRPDAPKIAMEAVAEAVKFLKAELSVPVFAGGKSFGGRMTTTAAAEGLLQGVRGILCFGFPLHAIGKPSMERGEHLLQVKQPILFLQGTRDNMGEAKLMRKVCAKLPKANLTFIEAADHSFGVLKSSGRTEKEVFEELVKSSSKFVRAQA